MRTTAWGIMEMKICAAYLRKITAENLEETHSPPLLEAIAIGDSLGYRFYLNRPPQLLVVDGEHGLASENVSSQLRNQGIEIISVADFKKRIKSNIEHHFLVLVAPDENLLQVVRESRRALPIRIVTTIPNNEFGYLPLSELRKLLTKPESDKTITLKIWEEWLKSKTGSCRLFIRPEEKEVADKLDLKGIAHASTETDHLFELNSGHKYVIYDRHGLIRKRHQSLLKKKMVAGEVAFYQSVEFSHPTRFVIDYASDHPSLKRSVLYGLLETGLTKVVLLDERIQKVICREQTNGADLQELEMMNIWVPCKREIDLDDPRHCYKALTNWLTSHLSDTTFLVVHLGIAEKLYKDNFGRMQNVAGEIETTFPNLNIIVISGRGLPVTIQLLGARFIQYSQVARCVLEEKSKYRLCNALFASRRPVE